MADTLADHRDTGTDSRDSSMGHNRRALSWWSMLLTEIICFAWFIGSIVWLTFLALLLITGIIVAVDHSFIWGLFIVVATMYTMERTGL